MAGPPEHPTRGTDRTIVARYLALLEQPVLSVTRAKVRLDAAVRRQEGASDVLEQLSAIQSRLNAQSRLDDAIADDARRAIAERDFIEHAATFAARRGISWAAWREVNVPAHVLRAAGITRSREHPGGPVTTHP
jgi:hypothetical protein